LPPGSPSSPQFISSRFPRREFGTPEDIVKVKRGYTGQFLAPVLGRRENKRKKGV
jgi:hypothetical protein